MRFDLKVVDRPIDRRSIRAGWRVCGVCKHAGLIKSEPRYTRREAEGKADRFNSLRDGDIWWSEPGIEVS